MKNWLGNETPETAEGSGKARMEQVSRTDRAEGEETGLLPRGFKLEGTLDVTGPLRLEGQVKGTVRSKAHVSLGKEAHIEGEVLCAFLSVAGKVSGNVHCTERLEILSTGVVEGDVHTPALGIEPGGILEGRCHMRAEAKTATAGRESPAPISVVRPASEPKEPAKATSTQGIA